MTRTKTQITIPKKCQFQNHQTARQPVQISIVLRATHAQAVALLAIMLIFRLMVLCVTVAFIIGGNKYFLRFFLFQKYTQTHIDEQYTYRFYLDVRDPYVRLLVRTVVNGVVTVSIATNESHRVVCTLITMISLRLPVQKMVTRPIKIVTIFLLVWIGKSVRFSVK